MRWLHWRRTPQGYPAGSCTRRVYDWVPWVPLGWGDACQWANSAREAGLVVTDRPRRGRIAVWPAVPVLRPYGHVALVSTVEGDGTFTALDGSPPQLVVTPPPIGGWPGTVKFIVPPGHADRRLPAGVFGNGRGADVDPIASVVSAWEQMRRYYSIGALIDQVTINAIGTDINTLL